MFDGFDTGNDYDAFDNVYDEGYDDGYEDGVDDVEPLNFDDDSYVIDHEPDDNENYHEGFMDGGGLGYWMASVELDEAQDDLDLLAQDENDESYYDYEGPQTVSLRAGVARVKARSFEAMVDDHIQEINDRSRR